MIQIDTSLKPTTSGSRFNRRNETAHLELYHFFYLFCLSFCLFANNWTQCLNVLQNKCMMGNHSNVSHVSPTLINGGILPLWFSWHSLLDFLHLTIIIAIETVNLKLVVSTKKINLKLVYLEYHITLICAPLVFFLQENLASNNSFTQDPRQSFSLIWAVQIMDFILVGILWPQITLIRRSQHSTITLGVRECGSETWSKNSHKGDLHGLVIHLPTYARENLSFQGKVHRLQGYMHL